ncbi:MAG TPA: protein-glutamate O-methyltransferase CheR [Candidatus Polarisedimenticolaceae bacterium]|nr:protein-glutamate O-methyltransferase CheR [Candidatus Polarisedimenticolaceae bacterium]
MLRPSDHDAELSEEEFRLLRDFIHERFGLFFEDNQRASLRTRLSGRLQSLDLLSFEDYYHYLRFSPQRKDELERMVSHLTNNETYFFREGAQLNVFSDHVLRTLRERKSTNGDRSLRLLSAGCSTGEEAHTLAMIVYDSGQFFWNWEVRIFGLDLDNEALEKARRATYHHNSFRALAPALLEKHFTRQGHGAQVKETIRRMVQLRPGNILDPASYDGLRPLDVILCRNVLIYFSDASILRAVRLFYEALAPGGYLLLGHAESLSRITDQLTPIRFPGAMIYQRPEART